MTEFGLLSDVFELLLAWLHSYGGLHANKEDVETQVQIGMAHNVEGLSRQIPEFSQPL